MAVRLTRRLLALLWPQGEPGLRVRVVIAVLLVIAAKLAAIGAPLVYKQVIDALSDKALVAAPVILILAYGLAQVGTEVLAALRQLLFVGVAQRAIRLTTVDVFRHLQRLSLRFHMNRRTGGLSRIMDRGAYAIESLLQLTLFEIAPTLFELVVVSVLLWRFYSAELALTTLAAVLAYLGFTLVATRWQLRFRREMNSRDVAASVKAMDSLLNYETVTYFGAEGRESRDYDAAKRAYEAAAIRHEGMVVLTTIGHALIIAAGSVSVMLMAAQGVAGRGLTVGDFVLINAYLLQLYAPLGMLGVNYGQVRQSLADVEAMDDLLRAPVEIEDRPGAGTLAVSGGRIVFDRVSFGYDARRPILRDVSFEAAPGETVAIVGETGGGKSTITRLLFRSYDVESGRITIDGQDIRDITRQSLRQAIGVVPQDTVLFHDTIYYNIAYGRPDATRDEVEAAARLARLHDFIVRLPEGYDTEVGERGLKLSGGEKQRVAIARTVLKAPSILVFDEATSALDNHTEADIQQSVRQVSTGRTTLVIAHRLSTVINADLILVMDQGCVVERGDHAGLLARQGLYASMWDRQSRTAEGADGR